MGTGACPPEHSTALVQSRSPERIHEPRHGSPDSLSRDTSCWIRQAFPHLWFRRRLAVVQGEHPYSLWAAAVLQIGPPVSLFFLSSRMLQNTAFCGAFNCGAQMLPRGDPGLLTEVFASPRSILNELLHSEQTTALPKPQGNQVGVVVPDHPHQRSTAHTSPGFTQPSPAGWSTTLRLLLGTFPGDLGTLLPLASGAGGLLHPGAILCPPTASMPQHLPPRMLPGLPSSVSRDPGRGHLLRWDSCRSTSLSSTAG